MEHTRIDSETHADQMGVTSRMQLSTGPERADGGAGPHALFSDMRDIAAGLTARARRKATDGIATLADSLEQRTGVVSLAKQKPAALLGTAFSIGFIIATVTGRPEGHWLVERVRRQIRTLLVGGAAAIVVQELREAAGADGLGELLDTWLAQAGSDDDADFDQG